MLVKIYHTKSQFELKLEHVSQPRVNNTRTDRFAYTITTQLAESLS